MRFAFVVFLLAAATSDGIRVTGYSDAEAECAACDIIAHAAQALLKQNARKLAVSEVARLEAVEQLCKRVDYAYPKNYAGKDGKQILGFVRVDGGILQKNQDEKKVKAFEEATHASELPEAIVRGKEPNLALRDHCHALIEEYDEDLSGLLKTSTAQTLRSDFCVRTARKCSQNGLRAIDEARKGQEPEMPSGMRPEDWPEYRRKMYNKRGKLKKNGLPKAEL
jgi:hypothetical protein